MIKTEQLLQIFQEVSAGKTAQLCFEAEGRVCLRAFRPRERLIVLGCGHIARPVSRYAADLGFRVIAVDDRPGFADRARFPEAEEVICDSFENAIRRLQPGPEDYVAVMTRGHRFDARCLRAILSGPLPKYLGMVGSRRRVAMLRRSLEEEGISKDSLERIHAPIGVDINALTVNEIAVSIAAELIGCRRSGFDRRGKQSRLIQDDIDLPLLEFISIDETPKAMLLVFETSGSTPVKSGAMMAVDTFGRTAGTIGGGCGENAALLEARGMIGSGEEKVIAVDLNNDLAAEEGMACGGGMRVLITDLAGSRADLDF